MTIPQLEHVSVSGEIAEFKRAVRNGTEFGEFTGHLATWMPDEEPGRFGVPDQFMRGAFEASIRDHKARKDRPIRMQAGHAFGAQGTIGGFPIAEVREDDIGLFVKGEINLEVRQGADIYALMKQGVISDLSIGVIVKEDDLTATVRKILVADIIEGSPVDHPMNRGATVSDVKNTQFANLPVHMPEGYVWNPNEAQHRLDCLLPEQKSQAFLWYRDETHCALPIADVIEGKLCAVPVAVQAATAALHEHLLDGDVPRDDVTGVVRTAEQYLAKMGIASPFTVAEKQFWGVRDVDELDFPGLERMLNQTGAFSKGAARSLASRLRVLDDSPEERKALDRMKADLKAMTDGLKSPSA